MINPLKELLATSPKVIAKFIFEVGNHLEKMIDEYDKLKAIKENAPEYEISTSQIDNSKDDSKNVHHWKLKFDDLWNKHQEVLRELLELKKKCST